MAVLGIHVSFRWCIFPQILHDIAVQNPFSIGESEVEASLNVTSVGSSSGNIQHIQPTKLDEQPGKKPILSSKINNLTKIIQLNINYTFKDISEKIDIIFYLIHI